MVRKTKEEALRTREAILDAAEHVFQEKGVARTTMDDIARAAGCTRGAVYWHFEDKLDLFTALMERIELPLFAEFERLLQEHESDPMEALLRSCLFALYNVEKNEHTRNALDILINRCEAVDEMAPIRRRDFERHQCFLRQSTDALRKAQAARQIRAELDPEICAFMIHVMITGLIREWLLKPESFSILERGSRIVTALFEGFGYCAPQAEQSLRLVERA